MFRSRYLKTLLTVRRHISRSAVQLTESSAIEVHEELDLTKPHTVVCESGVVACWHPEQPFPYEHSRPIDPQLLEDKKTIGLNKETDRIAGLQGSTDLKGPSNSELREIFYTNKHEWYTRYREERLYAVAAPQPKRKK